MEICRRAAAGTLESSDVYVELEPGEGIQVEIDSVVGPQFGDAIEAAVRSSLEEFQVRDVHIRLVDRGALECVIRARVETALMRGREEEQA